MTKKTAVILANVGTPDAPTVSAVRKFLFQFLNDRRVIDLPWLLQKVLVNLIIVPFRAPKSTKLYQKIWAEKGSPLLTISNNTRDKLQHELGESSTVYVAMRYGKPSLRKVLQKLESRNFERIVLLPMFPQYASSTTGTVVQLLNSLTAKWNAIPEINIIGQFYNHRGFIKAFAVQISKYNPAAFDHIIFSYHGLPHSQTDRIHPKIKTSECNCSTQFPSHGKLCYRATCYETTRLLANELNLNQSAYSVAFQSRLSKNWLEPFADEELVRLAIEGKKRILIVAPSFVADCLETIYEIGIEYQQIFKKHGGDELVLVESLNANKEWIKTLAEIVK
ncbi:MAG TPA: ferrochelatase [Prolixibacteraceae bacterium]|nr:ferrochelatase [Prolixibacteraceae bacterium]HPR59685.1 ferrochelatase [Prolixibacteraceae bacterium]